MNIGITGTRGFIGKNLIEALNCYSQKIDYLPIYSEIKSNNNFSTPKNYIDLDNLRLDDFYGVDCCVLLGAHSTCHPYESHYDCASSNIIKSLKLLQTSYDAGVNKFLIVGSCFEYGLSSNDYLQIPPDAPLKPIGSYPSSKAALCLMALDWAKQNKVTMIYSRLFQAYGKYERPSRFYPSLVRAALGGEDFKMSSGDQVRDILHSTQIAKKLINSIMDLELATLKNRVFVENICTGEPIMWRNFAESVWNQYSATGSLVIGSRSKQNTDLQRIVGLPDRVEWI